MTKTSRGLLAALLATAAAPAFAIDDAPAAAEAAAESAAAEAATGAGLDEIIVTAEKRETNLQRTPISISVASSQDLENRRIQSLADLADGAIPSLRVAPFFSRSSALTVGIRGIVPFDANQPSRDAAVGVYVDGVFLGRSQGLGAAMLDVERIEVLKGPQGTLFGRNAVGGAVSIVTKKPKGEFAMRTLAGIRNFGGYSVETHIDLPEWNNISLKLDGISTQRGGTVNNPMQGERDFNRFERRGLRASALWRPADGFEALYAFDISYDATTPFYIQLLTRNPAAPANSPLVQAFTDRQRDALVGVPQQDSVGKTNGHLLTLTWDASDAVTVKSISAYREVEQSQFDNGFGIASAVFRPNANTSRYSLASLDQHQFSQELQLIGSAPRLDYVLGAYYYYEKGTDDAWSPNTMRWSADGLSLTRLPSLEAGQTSPFPDRASTAIANSYAAFAQGTWTPPILDDRVRLTAGGRYTYDKRAGVLFKVNGQDTNIGFDRNWSRFDPMVTLAFDPTETIHLYAKYGTAYRAGGANSRSVNYRAFDPESVETWEIGAKTEFWDRRARLNVAAYTTRYKDIQIDFSAQLLEGQTRTTLETVNAPGNGRIRGVEVDLNLAPISGLSLSASYAYTKGDLPLAQNPFNNNNFQKPFIIFTPEHAFSVAGDYSVDVGGATLKAHLDANASGAARAQSGDPTLSDRSFLVNGRLALGDIDVGRGGSAEFALWSRNLLDRQQTFLRSILAVQATGVIGIYNEPRTFGADVQIRF
ncbi:TonB-dependent receptor [Polymorphobacter sp.]|uniref:TonB-dependent receptor n=1 Tax=Polymorphobacter sp. TaxID=1909290 RepID=UPI003F71A337